MAARRWKKGERERDRESTAALGTGMLSDDGAASRPAPPGPASSGHWKRAKQATNGNGECISLPAPLPLSRDRPARLPVFSPSPLSHVPLIFLSMSMSLRAVHDIPNCSGLPRRGSARHRERERATGWAHCAALRAVHCDGTSLWPGLVAPRGAATSRDGQPMPACRLRASAMLRGAVGQPWPGSGLAVVKAN